MERVYSHDIEELCEELGIVKDTAGETLERIEELLDDDGIGFLCKYTAALLNAIEVGSTNLTGTKETYKGFGTRINDRTVSMILKVPYGGTMS